MIYKFLDISFFVFHVILIIFNLFGWALPRLRKLNFTTLAITGFSWFILGIFYGWGYCFLTDWHWQVRQKLGYSITSNSYIHFMITSAFNISITEDIVDVVTVVFYFSALFISTWLNFFNRNPFQEKDK